MKQKSKVTINEVAGRLSQQATPAVLKEALGSLPEELAKVVELYFFEQLSVKEISEKIRRSPTTAAKKLLQGCYYLEKHLQTPACRRAQQILYSKQPNRISF